MSFLGAFAPLFRSSPLKRVQTPLKSALKRRPATPGPAPQARPAGRPQTPDARRPGARRPDARHPDARRPAGPPRSPVRAKPPSNRGVKPGDILRVRWTDGKEYEAELGQGVLFYDGERHGLEDSFEVCKVDSKGRLFIMASNEWQERPYKLVGALKKGKGSSSTYQLWVRWFDDADSGAGEFFSAVFDGRYLRWSSGGTRSRATLSDGVMQIWHPERRRYAKVDYVVQRTRPSLRRRR